MKTLPLENYLALREGATVLESDGFGDKVLKLADGSFLKLFRRKRLISSAAWSPYAQRFADNAQALEDRSIPCPRIISVFRIMGLSRDGQTLRQVVLDGVTPSAQQALRIEFNQFVRRLHDLGIYFRSLHLGNVVLTPAGDLGLIDISDIRVHRKPLSAFWRARNLKRMENIANECDWLDHDLILNGPKEH